jgi:hypothetical protein
LRQRPQFCFSTLVSPPSLTGREGVEPVLRSLKLEKAHVSESRTESRHNRQVKTIRLQLVRVVALEDVLDVFGKTGFKELLRNGQRAIVVFLRVYGIEATYSVRGVCVVS